MFVSVVFVSKKNKPVVMWQADNRVYQCSFIILGQSYSILCEYFKNVVGRLKKITNKTHLGWSKIDTLVTLLSINTVKFINDMMFIYKFRLF